jgi:hypothetical protein
MIVDLTYMARIWRMFGKPKLGKPANYNLRRRTVSIGRVRK